MNDDVRALVEQADQLAQDRIDRNAEIKRLRDRAGTARTEAERILALTTGPWSEGEGLPPLLRDAMVVRFKHLADHARAILAALDEEPTS